MPKAIVPEPPGRIENRVILTYSFTKIDDFTTLKVVLHPKRYGVTVASLCRGMVPLQMARLKKLSFLSWLNL